MYTTAVRKDFSFNKCKLWELGLSKFVVQQWELCVAYNILYSNFNLMKVEHFRGPLKCDP